MDMILEYDFVGITKDAKYQLDLPDSNETIVSTPEFRGFEDRQYINETSNSTDALNKIFIKQEVGEFSEDSVDRSIKQEEFNIKDENLFIPVAERFAATHTPRNSSSQSLEFTVKMYPVHDLVVSLREIPFSNRSESEKKEILDLRPTPLLQELGTDKKRGTTFARSFKASWYETYSWLCGSSYLQKLFCWPCLLLASIKSVWTTEGYYDLKNLSRALNKHGTSKEHIKFCMNFKRLKKDVLEEVAVLCKTIYNERVSKNRLLLSYLTDVTVLLAKREPTGENFIEVFYAMISYNEELKRHISELGEAFCFKTIQSELIECISEVLKDKIVAEINNAEFFAVMVDDLTEITEKSQLAVCLRYVEKDSGILHERFLGFFEVNEEKTAATVYNILLDLLAPFNYKEILIAQCYDGASVLANHINGLQEKIKNNAPQALCVHSPFHTLNSVIKDGSKCIKQSRLFFATVNSISSYFRRSTKGQLQTFSETSTSKSKILNLIFAELTNFVVIFNDIINDPASSSESIEGATNFLRRFLTLEFIFLVLIYHHIMSITGTLDSTLQERTLNLNYCKRQIIATTSKVKDMRNENSYKNFRAIAGIKLDAALLLNQQYENIKRISTNDDFKNLYYEILDNVLVQLQARFADVEKLSFLALLDTSNYEQFNAKFPRDLLNNLLKTYNFFEKDRLEKELSVVYGDDEFKACHLKDLMRYIKDRELEDVFQQVHRLCALFYTLPITSASANNEVSCLIRVKRYLRGDTLQDASSSWATVSIEKELLLENVNSELKNEFYELILKKFIVIKHRQLDLEYKK